MRGLGWIYLGEDQAKGTVSRVGFGPSLEVNVSDILALYGPPDSLFIYSEGTPEHPLVDARLVFNDTSMILGLPYEEGFFYTLDPGDDVLTANYFDTAQFSANTALMERYSQPWNGYERYEP